MCPKTGIKVPKSSPLCFWATLVLEFPARLKLFWQYDVVDRFVINTKIENNSNVRKC